MQFTEFISSVLGLLAVWLNTKGKIWGWPLGIVSVLLASVVYYQVRLYGESSLQIVYALSNVYGWMHWKSSGSFKPRTLPRSGLHIPMLTTTFVALYVLYSFLLSSYFAGTYPYVDALVTALSLIAQYLLTKRYLENWLLWIPVNLICVVVYLSFGLWWFAGLYALFFYLGLIGYRQWRAMLNE